MPRIRSITAAGVAGLTMTTLAVGLPTAANAVDTTDAPSITTVGDSPVESHVQDETDGSKTHYGTAFFHGAEPTITAKVSSAQSSGRLEVRDVATRALICATDVPAVQGTRSCTPTLPLAYGSITEMSATVVTDGVTSAASDTVDAQRLLDDTTIVVDAFDAAASTAAVSGVGSIEVPFVVRSGDRELATGTTAGDGSWTASLSGVRPGETVIVSMTVGHSRAAANVVLAQDGVGALTAPVVHDLSIDQTGTLVGFARTTGKGTIQITDADGAPVTSGTGTTNPTGADIRFNIPRAVKGATYTAVLTDGDRTATTTFTAPGGAVAPEPGTGDPAVPVVRDLIVDAAGRLTGTAEVGRSGVLQIQDGEGRAASRPVLVSNPIGADARFSVEAVVAGGSYVAVFSEGGRVARTAFTAPGTPAATELTAPVVHDLSIDQTGTLVGFARTTGKGTIQITDADGAPVTSGTGTTNPTGADIRFNIPRAVKGATYTAVLTDGDRTATTTFTAPGAGGDASIHGTATVTSFDAASGTAVLSGTASAPVEYWITVRRGSTSVGDRIRGWTEQDGTWEHDVDGLRTGDVVTVLFVRDNTNQHRVTVTV